MSLKEKKICFFQGKQTSLNTILIRMTDQKFSLNSFDRSFACICQLVSYQMLSQWSILENLIRKNEKWKKKIKIKNKSQSKCYNLFVNLGSIFDCKLSSELTFPWVNKWCNIYQGDALSKFIYEFWRNNTFVIQENTALLPLLLTI